MYLSLISILVSAGSFAIYYLMLVPVALFVAIPVALFLYRRWLRPLALSDLPERRMSSAQEDAAETCPVPSKPVQQAKKSGGSPAGGVLVRNRIVMTKEIDSLLRKMLDNLVDYYLMVWYRPLVVLQKSGHRYQEAQASLDRLRQLLRDNLWVLISCFIDRLYTVNYVTFLSQDLVNRLLKHFQNLNHSPLDNSKKTQSTVQDDDTHSRTFGHRKNQSSISSIFSNNSSTSISSTNSDVSSISDDPTTPSLANQIKQPFQTFFHNQQSRSNSLFHNFPFMGKHGGPDDTAKNEEVHHFPLASHLTDAHRERQLLQCLVEFILDTLFRDINGAADVGCTMKLVNNCRVLKLLLGDLLSKILFDLIETVSAPKIINCQIVMILKQYILLKDLLFNNTENLSAMDDDEDDDGDGHESGSDQSENQPDDGREFKLVKRNLLILNEMKQCIIENDFNHLYELIDQCNNVRSLKHIRLKLIGEILNATVVSHLNRSNHPAQTFWYDEMESETSSVRGGIANSNFNFNAKMNLKFKKYKQEKNIKRLKTRLQFAKTLCEQKIQFRKRTAAQRLINESQNGNRQDQSFSFQTSELLVKSISLDDTSSSLQQQRPQQKKIFKFHQIMANQFSREYFKQFLKQSLLQNDESKRSSLMKFRKDVLLIDCTVYMLEFWEHLQMVFENFARLAPDPPDFQTYRQSYLLILTMVTDNHFFYTFSKQFLTISSDLMHSLERFLLGDIELSLLDLSGREPFFRDRNVDHNFVFCTPMQPDPEYVLKRIDWKHYLSIFVQLEKVLFDCLNDEFYPQFLISEEYDQMLCRYFEHRHTAEPTLIDLSRELASDRWLRTAEEPPESSVLIKLSHLAKMKPSTKILLVDDNGDHHKKSGKKQSLDLHKNRRMIFNSIEFPFVYLCYVKLVLLARLKLKMAIGDILAELTEKDGLSAEIPAILARDIDDTRLLIQHFHQILMRVFCWLNADFSCSVTNVHFRRHYAQLLQSSTSHTTESKIMSFMENLFSKSAPLHDNPNHVVSADRNLMFHVHVTALLSKFQYNRDQGTLPTSIRNELMSNWSYQWTVEVSLDQLQSFYQKEVKPLIRIVLFLIRFHIHSYLTVVHDRLGEAKQRQRRHEHTNARILEKFIHTSNHILTEIKQLIRTETRKLSVSAPQPSSVVPKPAAQNKNSPISFRQLLERDASVDQAAQEATPELLLMEETLKPSPEPQPTANDDDQMKQMENLLNIFFQQLTAQEHVVKSLGFLSFAGYEQDQEQRRKMEESRPGPCPRCLLNQQMFDANQDYGLNHQVQLFLFRLLFTATEDRDWQDHLVHQLTTVGTDERETAKLKLPLLIHVLVNPASSADSDQPDDNQQSNRDNKYRDDPTPRLLFMQARSLLAEKSAPDVLDFVLDSLRRFDPNRRTDYCNRCCGAMSVARRKLSTVNPEMARTMDGRGVSGKFRLFNNQQQDDGEDNRSAGTISNSSSEFKFGLGSLFSSFGSAKNHPDQLPEHLPDILLNETAFGLDHDDPPLMSYDESQLVEPLFQLLIEIFELKGGMVTRTLRRTLMFGIRLFLGQTKMMSRPYLQFLQSFFTEKSIFKIFWQLNLYLETLLAQQSHATVAAAEAEAVATAMVAELFPGTAVPPEEEPSKIDEYLADLNQLLNSFEAETVAEMETGNNQCVMAATELEQRQKQQLQEENIKLIDTEKEEMAERERKLQIIAKQLLFVSTPTFLNHLFGQENINKGLNKCFDALQY